MNNSIDQLSQLILEADALLLLLHRHREDTPSDAIVLLKRKLQVILSLIDDIETEEAEEEAEEEQKAEEPELTPAEAPSAVAAEPTPQEPSYGEEPEELSHIDKQEETDAPVFFTQPEITEYTYSGISSSHNTAWDDVADEFEDMVEGADRQTEPNREETPAAEAPQKKETTEEYLAPAEPKAAAAPAAPTIPAAPAANTTRNAQRRPVSTIFNLNDKFRFRRELFGNSEIAYVECLDMLSAMYSLDEATEYLYEDLNWDPANEDVKAFVDLLKTYYNN